MKLVKDIDKRPSKNPEVTDKQAEEALRTILTWIGENPEREGLLETPKRVVKAFKEYFKGYHQNAETELSVLEFIYDRIAKGGIILFDDYGWSHYKDQQVKEKEFLEKRGQKTLELPTGQGLLIKW